MIDFILILNFSNFFPAKFRFIDFKSSFGTDAEFLVAGEDYSVIQFDVSGNNSVHSFLGENGPQFHYTTANGISHKVRLKKEETI